MICGLMLALLSLPLAPGYAQGRSPQPPPPTDQRQIQQFPAQSGTSNSQKPSYYREECGHGLDGEGSHLCAQWASADAAGAALDGNAPQNRLASWSSAITAAFTFGTVWIAFQALWNSHKSERPYVYFYKTKKRRRPSGKVLGIDGVTFINVGRTAARVTHLTVEHCLAKHPPAPRDLALQRYPPDIAIFPGEEWPGGAYFELKITADDFRRQSIDSETRLYCYGRLVYEDPFNKATEVWFCRVLANSNFGFAPNQIPEMESEEFNGTRDLCCVQRWRVSRQAVARRVKE